MKKKKKARTHQVFLPYFFKGRPEGLHVKNEDVIEELRSGTCRLGHRVAGTCLTTQHSGRE